MIHPWHSSRYELKFQLSDFTFARWTFDVQTCYLGLDAGSELAEVPPSGPQAGSDGFIVRGMRSDGRQEKVRSSGSFIIYTVALYHRHYIDLTGDFEAYLSEFRSKTRATLRRKVNKFSKFCGGNLDFRVYRTPEELREFHAIARKVSARTYQEGLLDAGLPETAEFNQTMEASASEDNVRAYLLFHDRRPVSYLYLSAVGGTLLYEYLGYDPEYSKWSVGTVLHWCAIESIFSEHRFQALDFTEGEGQHKKTFGRQHIPCATTLYLKAGPLNALLVRLHCVTDRVSGALGRVTDRLGLKTRIRKLIRS